MHDACISEMASVVASASLPIRARRPSGRTGSSPSARSARPGRRSARSVAGQPSELVAGREARAGRPVRRAERLQLFRVILNDGADVRNLPSRSLE
jgi:hypothetical protein